MNYISQAIIDVFKEKYPNDKGYVQQKEDRLKNSDKFDALLFACNLDDSNLGLLAGKLNVSEYQLEMTIEPFIFSLIKKLNCY